MDADKIDDDIKVLLVIHPREITDKAQFAHGPVHHARRQADCLPGSAAADRQPRAEPDVRQHPQRRVESGQTAEGLGPSLRHRQSRRRHELQDAARRRNGQPQEAPAFLSLTPEGINTEDIVTSQIDNIWLPFAGAFTGTPVAGLKQTVLLKSTKDSQLVDGFMANCPAKT